MRREGEVRPPVATRRLFQSRPFHPIVMPGLVPGIHDFFGVVRTSGVKKVVDGRHKADHDGGVNVRA
jgi:hypothetical protein